MKSKPFFCILLLFIAFIWITNIKKEFSLLGWDNYSSYFNLKTNMLRTFFSTWREYRGLGVPSDSEVTNIARQLFFSIFSLFLSKNLLDQVYYLFSFSVGLVGMYKLASYIIVHYDTEKKFAHYADIFAFLAAFFYLFNLNTLSIFYFPIVMFVTRFFALPVLFYIFLRLINDKSFTLKQIFLYLILFFMASGSFMVPTVFIATVIALGILVVVQKKLIRSLIVFFVFLSLSSFWIFPFINYSIQKSTDVRLTPTFIDSNEGFTNKNKSYYDAWKQMIFYPQFFDMKFTDSKIWVQEYFHPLAGMMNAYPNNFIALQLFPLLYLLGGIFILIRAGKKREWLWIPGILFVFLFLSMKEYSPLGFIYAFLSRNIPIFGVIFRFADTKFHAYAAFTGSIAASFACIYLYDFFRRYINKKTMIGSFILIFILPTFFLYQEYFKGNLIGFFMFNKVPSAYQQIADIINSDPENVRVVHLPVDKSDYYWKPYSWGLYSSAFLNYMLDKPLFDKTFEPASLENIYVDKKIDSIQKNIQLIQNETDVINRINDFVVLLQKLGVKYVIDDGTVTDRINSRGIDVWGTFSPASNSILINKAVSLGLIKKLKVFDVDMNEFKGTYSQTYPFKKAYFDDIEEKNRILPITLYEVTGYNKKISFIDKAQNVDDFSPDIVNFASDNPSVSTIQKNISNKASIYPFLHTDNEVSFTDKTIDVVVPLKESVSGQYTLHLDGVEKLPNRTYLIETTVRKGAKNVTLSIYHRFLPTVNNKDFISKLTEIVLTPTQLINGGGKMGVRIGTTVFPIPDEVATNEESLGAVVVSKPNFSIDIVQEYGVRDIDTHSFEIIPNINCYKDALSDYSYNLTAQNNRSLDISSLNGSVCLQAKLKSMFDSKTTHAIFQFNIEGNSQDMDTEFGYKSQSETTKPLLKQVVSSLQKPQHLKICIKESSYDECYNTHDLQVGGRKRVELPVERNLDGMLEPMLFLGLRSMGYQKQTMKLDNLTVTLFETKQHLDVSISPSNPSERIVLANSNTIRLSSPLSRSSSSYYYKPNYDSFYFYNSPCQYYRTFRSEKARVISYVEQCDNTLLVDLPYSNDNFYIWELGYNVAAGQQPYFILADKNNQYKNERISFNQGYPDIPGFKKLQGPEFFVTKENIQNILETLPSVQAYTYIYPQADIPDNNRKSFFIKQFTENEGAFMIDSFHIAELPNIWSKLVITPDEGRIEYSQPMNYDFKSILPSLWKIVIPPHKDNQLLKFNEGYDTQWGIYEGLKGLLFGKELNVHNKCDGYANCFEIQPQQTDKTYYIFYWPEKLSLFGWIVTFFVAIFALLRTKKPLKVDK